MYSTVPTGPSSVRGTPRSRAVPKSISVTSPPRRRNTFSGLRSPCTTPRSCSASTARRSPRAITRSSGSGCGSASSASRSASVGSAIRSITRKSRPACSIASISRGTCGGGTPSSTRRSMASRRAPEATPARATLIATAAPSVARRASSTTPWPPAPSTRSIA